MTSDWLKRRTDKDESPDINKPVPIGPIATPLPQKQMKNIPYKRTSKEGAAIRWHRETNPLGQRRT